MNISIIRRILGYVIAMEGIFMLLPCIVALCYHENQGVVYLIISVLLFLFGSLVAVKKPKSNVFYLKEGGVATALCWIALSVFGCLPFYFTGEIPSIVDALFETISGFSTTGASILNDVEALSHASLFWRSFTHLLGGMGVLVFLMAVIQMVGGSNINLMKAESPGPTVSKLVPKMKQTARVLYVIYFSMTLIEIILLCIGDMPVFDAITLSFGTAGTGGFGIRNDSIASYSTYSQVVITVFMILFGVNFNAYYFILLRQFKKAAKLEEVRMYFLIIIGAVFVIFLDIVRIYQNVGEALCKAAFQVGAVITTTGYSTADFDTWSTLSKGVMVLLMFIGACAGSTGGGLKLSRIMIAFKSVLLEIHSYIHPKSVKKITLDGKPLERDTIRATNVYLVTFAFVYTASFLLVSLDGFDMTTTFTSIIAAVNNIGPGLAGVGPTKNFSDFSDFSKLVLSFDMLAGRLEFFPMLIIFNPKLWLNSLHRKPEKSK